MITTNHATNRVEFREYINQLKVNNQKRIFSPDEVNYLADCYDFEAVEFKQESETDEEFLQLFSTWLHERPKKMGHVDYYVLFYLRTAEHLSREQFEFMERNVAECFDISHGWLYEINDRIRFRLRIRLMCSYKRGIRRLTRKEWRMGMDIEK